VSTFSGQVNVKTPYGCSHGIPRDHAIAWDTIGLRAQIGPIADRVSGRSLVLQQFFHRQSNIFRYLSE
jgi:hypothetical protein